MTYEVHKGVFSRSGRAMCPHSRARATSGSVHLKSVARGCGILRGVHLRLSQPPGEGSQDFVGDGVPGIGRAGTPRNRLIVDESVGERSLELGIDLRVGRMPDVAYRDTKGLAE